MSHISIETVDKETYGEEFEEYAGEGIGMTSPDEGVWPTIHNDNSVKRLLNNPKYSDFFHDYRSSELETWEHMVNWHDSFIQHKKDNDWTNEDWSKFMTGQGLLFGYPDDSAKGYFKLQQADSQFQSEEPQLSREQKALKEGYFWGKPVYELCMSEEFDESSPEGKTALEDAKSRVKLDEKNQFIDDHQSEIRSLLKENFSEIDDDGRDALVSYRGKYLFGQYHLADSRSKRDEYYYAKLEYIFRSSGMPEYLASLQSSTS